MNVNSFNRKKVKQPINATDLAMFPKCSEDHNGVRELLAGNFVRSIVKFMWNLAPNLDNHHAEFKTV